MLRNRVEKRGVQKARAYCKASLCKSGLGAGLALWLFAGIACAADFRVTMTDGSAVSGQILSFEDGRYDVRTSGGVITLDVRGVKRIDVSGPAGRVQRTAGVAVPAPFGVVATGASPTFRIGLKSGDEIVGRITAFDDGVYTVSSNRGNLQVSVRAVRQIDVSSYSAPALAAGGAAAIGGLPAFRIALNSGEEVTGAITAFDDGVYTVSSNRGNLQLSVRAVRKIDVASLSLPVPGGGAAAAGPGSGLAKFRMALSAGADVQGAITAFDDGVYTVATARGRVLLPVQAVTKITLLGYQKPQDIATAQAGPTLRLSGRIRIAGSDSMGEALVPMLLESYAGAAGSRNASWSQSASSLQRKFRATGLAGQTLDAEINRRGLTAGLEALARDEADITMMSRALTASETDLLRQSGLPNPTAPGQEHVVGLSGIVVLLHPSNPVRSLTLEQIVGIFSGNLRSWADVGGRPRRIRVFTPPATSGEMDVFKRDVLKTVALSPTARPLPSSSELSDVVSSDPTAIGFAEYGFIRNAAAVAIKGPCGISHPPSEFSIQTEEYPLSGRLLLYSRPQSAGSTIGSFLKYVVSDEAQKRLSAYGAVSLLPTIAERDASKFAVQNATAAGELQLLSNLRDVVQNGRRLSLTFRFATATSQLDARATQDIERLVTFLRSNRNGGRRLALLGFADSRGAFGRNQTLSQQRARTVANKLEGLGVTPDLVAGFSSLAPVVCETSRAMMAKNRRVEVWLF